MRVKQGGHNVPAADIERRFERGWTNFDRAYKKIADSWSVYNNTGDLPILIAESNG